MLLAIVSLAAVTAVSIWWHVRSSSTPSAPAATHSCPRCHARNPAGAEHCDSCGVPLQALELVSAPIVDHSDEADADGGALHAMVRGDVCVGCGTCVDVCPEPGAIRLVGKLAVVDIDRCKGHGQCATACAVGGILMTTGAAVQRIESPLVDGNFQTNVPGLYVVGELGGRGLIKNAINEGKIAAEHVAAQIRTASLFSSRSGDVYDVIIVGSGPAGLSAGLEALRSGLRYLILEQGELSDTIRKYPRSKLLLAEPVRVPVYGDLWITDASKESLLKVWQTVIRQTGLQVRCNSRVESVAWAGDRFEVAVGEQRFSGHHVVLALGRRGNPRRLEVPGEELPKTLYDIVEMEEFAGSRVLVVGGGDSAVESAVGLARQNGTTVTLSYRGEAPSRVKDRNREKLDEAIAAGDITPLYRSQVTAIRDDEVELDVDGKRLVLPNDYVIVRIGGTPPFAFLRGIGVQIVTKELSFEPTAAAVGA